MWFPALHDKCCKLRWLHNLRPAAICHAQEAPWPWPHTGSSCELACLQLTFHDDAMEPDVEFFHKLKLYSEHEVQQSTKKAVGALPTVTPSLALLRPFVCLMVVGQHRAGLARHAFPKALLTCVWGGHQSRDTEPTDKSSRPRLRPGKQHHAHCADSLGHDPRTSPRPSAAQSTRPPRSVPPLWQVVSEQYEELVFSEPTEAFYNRVAAIAPRPGPPLSIAQHVARHDPQVMPGACLTWLPRHDRRLHVGST